MRILGVDREIGDMLRYAEFLTWVHAVRAGEVDDAFANRYWCRYGYSYEWGTKNPEAYDLWKKG